MKSKKRTPVSVTCKDLIVELPELVLKCDSNCTSCHKYILQLTNHIKTVHSGDAGKSNLRRSSRSRTSVNYVEPDPVETIPSTQKPQIRGRDRGPNSELNMSGVRDTKVQSTLCIETDAFPPSGIIVLDSFEIKDEPEDEEIDIVILNDPLFDFVFEPEPEDAEEDAFRQSDQFQTSPKKTGKQISKTKYVRKNAKKSSVQPEKKSTKTKCKLKLGKNISNCLTEATDAQKSYTCEICKRNFLKSEYLRRHLIIHKNVKRYKCDQCDKAFVRSDTLADHKRSHTGEKPYMCEICSKHFYNHQSLSQYLLRHRGEKNHVCSICEKSFVVKAQLIRHMKFHTGEKPFKCDQCDKCYSRPDKLVTHKRSHTGVKPYTCDQCDKCFTDGSILKNHKETHKEGRQEYFCEQCGKGFKRKTFLTAHYTIHTGEKNSVCEVCGKCFRLPRFLAHHRKTHNL